MEKFTKTKYDNIEVSNYGRIYNTKTERFIGTVGTNDYIKVRVKIGNDYRTIEAHRIIAETLVSGYQPGYVVHHIDENKTNNNITNLRWVTQSENLLLATKPKKYYKLSEDQHNEVKELYAGGKSLIEITNIMNNKHSINVSRITYTQHARS